jgi:hypothetical protein
VLASENLEQEDSHILGPAMQVVFDHGEDCPLVRSRPAPIGVNPIPRPPAQPPNPECESQNPTDPWVPGPLDNQGRATKATRLLNFASLVRTPRPTPTYTPIGFQSGMGQDRSHLLAHIFGGPTAPGDPDVEKNIVALFSEVNQQPNGCASTSETFRSGC